MPVTFKSLSFLNKELIDAYSKLGYTTLLPIQEKTISLIAKGKSLIALAPTGTGKTLAFLTPILNDLEIDATLQAIIIVPTITLGEQIYNVIQTIKKELNNNEISVSLFRKKNDIFDYKNTAHIVILTPSNFEYLKENYDLSEVKRIIIDEGDMIAYDGFEQELINIKSSVECPVTIFSASLKEHQITTLSKLIKASDIIDLREKKITADTVKHVLVNIKHLSYSEALNILLKNIEHYKAIFFVSMKKDMEEIKAELDKKQIYSQIFNGDIAPREKKTIISNFKNGKFYYLLSSDYGARGLDIDDVDCVISVDLPQDLDYYFHRAGRTGRNGKSGISYVFYRDSQTKGVENLIKRLNKVSYLTIKNGELISDSTIRKINKTKKNTSPELEAQIKEAVRKTRTKKVKPNYKKKVRMAVEKTKRRYRRKMIDDLITSKNRKKR